MKHCRAYLEENAETWAKRKRIRQEQEEKRLRVEKARQLSRQSKMTALDKKIQQGLELLPREKREHLVREEMKRNRMELEETKTSLWKLSSRDKKKKKKNQLSSKN